MARLDVHVRRDDSGKSRAVAARSERGRFMDRSFKSARIAFAVPLAVGCASVGQGTQYTTMRERVARVEHAAPAPEEAVEDPFASAATLTRSTLVAAVLERNPGLEAARAAWKAELARYPQETALPDPMFSYSTRPRSFDSRQVEPANDFDLSQEIPFPGKLGLRGARALAEADAAGGEFESERLRLAVLASSLYDRYWVAERAIETNAHHLALVEETHGVALSRYAAGTGFQQDVLAAETERATMLREEIGLETERRILAERINALLHRPAQLELPPLPEDLGSVAPPELDEQTLFATALAKRPELRAAAAEVRSREAEVSLARRDFLPDFTVRAGYETTWQEDPLKPVVGLELNVPLQLGRRFAALEEADARLVRERSRLRQLEDRVRLQVVSAVARIRESQRVLELSQTRLLPAARQRLTGARAAFSSGQATFLELADAERGLRSAEQAYFEARAELSIRNTELARAIGVVEGIEEGQQ
jgi:outer membrane protein, heavy metal efflux system